MTDRFRDLLSDYLDHHLPPAEADALERHLDACVECREVLVALARVRSQAASLVDPPAPTDLWAGIASRIGTAGSSSGTPARRIMAFDRPRHAATWGLPQWLGAAAAFAVLTAGALWLAHDRLPPPLRPVAGAAGPSGAPGGTDASLAGFDPTRIEGEIGQLQQALDRGRGKLDPKTVAVLEANLRIIRKATEDARRALEQDPANRDLQEYLAGSVQRKFDMVRRAAVLAGV